METFLKKAIFGVCMLSLTVISMLPAGESKKIFAQNISEKAATVTVNVNSYKKLTKEITNINTTTTTENTTTSAVSTTTITETTPTTVTTEIKKVISAGKPYIVSKNSDMTAFFYVDKTGILKGGSGRELIPGYSVGCLVEHHKELYGKIVQIHGTGIEDFEKKHFRIDDSGYGNGKDEFLIDFYAGTGEQYKQILTEEQLTQGRFKNLTVTVIGEWDEENNCEILY
jgi:hypothetical protein